MAEANAARGRTALYAFLLRLAFVSFCLAGSILLMKRLREHDSRYQPVALAAVVASVLQALVLAGDYGSDYVDIDDLGPLVIWLVGIAMTMSAFVALHRFVVKRLPIRRARRGECAFCGWPAPGRHCEGCGRSVNLDCDGCGTERRVGAPHCAACGSL